MSMTIEEMIKKQRHIIPTDVDKMCLYKIK